MNAKGTLSGLCDDASIPGDTQLTAGAQMPQGHREKIPSDHSQCSSCLACSPGTLPISWGLYAA